MLFHALLFSMLYSPPYETSLHAVCFPALFVVKCFMLIHDLCCSTGTLRWSYFTPSNFVVPYVGPYYTISRFASSCFMLPHALLLHALLVHASMANTLLLKFCRPMWHWSIFQCSTLHWPSLHFSVLCCIVLRCHMLCCFLAPCFAW